MLDLLAKLTPAHVWSALNAVAMAAFVAGLVLSTLFGAFRLAYQRVTGSPLPRTRVVVWIEVLLEMLPNALGSYNKVRAARGEPLFELPKPDATPTPPTGGED